MNAWNVRNNYINDSQGFSNFSWIWLPSKQRAIFPKTLRKIQGYHLKTNITSITSIELICISWIIDYYQYRILDDSFRKCFWKNLPSILIKKHTNYQNLKKYGALCGAKMFFITKACTNKVIWRHNMFPNWNKFIC